ncbi:uncharacterized protein LOC142024694 [Carettochelys insculpta]|uniref:uncharacterized protein LOC142024694 n=1 Tax=Carettochelys insculpta TaxID=44489 RepID=UPI003EBF1B34
MGHIKGTARPRGSRGAGACRGPAEKPPVQRRPNPQTAAQEASEGLPRGRAAAAGGRDAPDRPQGQRVGSKPLATPGARRHLGAMDLGASVSAHPEVLSLENMARVRNRLVSLGALSRPMEECLDHAILQVSREADYLQENARLVVRCDSQQLEFVAGQGESSIEVFYFQGVPQYQVVLPAFDSSVEKLPGGKLVLSLDNLDNLVVQKGLTRGLRFCLIQAKRRLAREPESIQENARMVVKSDGQVLNFLSGDGVNSITVYLIPDGNLSYSVVGPGS